MAEGKRGESPSGGGGEIQEPRFQWRTSLFRLPLSPNQQVVMSARLCVPTILFYPRNSCQNWIALSTVGGHKSESNPMYHARPNLVVDIQMLLHLTENCIYLAEIIQNTKWVAKRRLAWGLATLDWIQTFGHPL